MKLYLTHVGIMMLKQVGLFRLPIEGPKHVSIRIGINKYHHIEYNAYGRIYMNNVLAAIDGERYLNHEAVEMASTEYMEVVGVVDFQKY